MHQLYSWNIILNSLLIPEKRLITISCFLRGKSKLLNYPFLCGLQVLLQPISENGPQCMPKYPDVKWNIQSVIKICALFENFALSRKIFRMTTFLLKGNFHLSTLTRWRQWKRCKARGTVKKSSGEEDADLESREQFLCPVILCQCMGTKILFISKPNCPFKLILFSFNTISFLFLIIEALVRHAQIRKRQSQHTQY